MNTDIVMTRTSCIILCRSHLILRKYIRMHQSQDVMLHAFVSHALSTHLPVRHVDISASKDWNGDNLQLATLYCKVKWRHSLQDNAMCVVQNVARQDTHSLQTDKRVLQHAPRTWYLVLPCTSRVDHLTSDCSMNTWLMQSYASKGMWCISWPRVK